MGTGDSCGINRRTAWCTTSPASVVWQCKPVSGWRLRKRRSAPTCRLYGSGKHVYIICASLMLFLWWFAVWQRQLWWCIYCRKVTRALHVLMAFHHYQHITRQSPMRHLHLISSTKWWWWWWWWRCCLCDWHLLLAAQSAAAAAAGAVCTQMILRLPSFCHLIAMGGSMYCKKWNIRPLRGVRGNIARTAL